jgi:hypothetical protein
VIRLVKAKELINFTKNVTKSVFTLYCEDLGGGDFPEIIEGSTKLGINWMLWMMLRDA